MGLFKNIVDAKISGNVGSMNFRKRGSLIVVAERVYKNSSAGAGATETQRLHRCRLANIVNLYKVIKAIEAKAWENKGQNVSDFNMFTKYNLAANPVLLKQQEAVAGACVIAPYVVSKGSLGDLVQSHNYSGFLTGVKVNVGMNMAQVTISDISKSIIENNGTFENGDKISIACLTNVIATVGGVVIPQTSVVYFELTLDTAKTSKVSDLTNFDEMYFAVDASGNLIVRADCDGFFAVHSRITNGKLLTSAQSIIMADTNSEIYTTYTSDEQKQAAMKSYGYVPDVLLTPGSVLTDVAPVSALWATISSVTYGLNALANGASIESGNVLTITGTNLQADTITVSVNGTSYVPLSNDGSTMIFSLGYAGTLHIYKNGILYLSATITQAASIQQVTSMTVAGTTVTAGSSNIGKEMGSSDVIVINGNNLGSITATGATLSNISESATQITATVTYPSTENQSYTVSVGGVVVLSGTTYNGVEEGSY